MSAQERLSSINQAITDTRNKQFSAENKIKSLGPDTRKTLEAQRLSLQAEINSGMGSFVELDKLIDRQAEADLKSKERDAAYSVWMSCRDTIRDLEKRREALRDELDREMRARVKLPTV